LKSLRFWPIFLSWHHSSNARVVGFYLNRFKDGAGPTPLFPCDDPFIFRNAA